MAVVTVPRIARGDGVDFIGLSTDTKPGAITVPAGARFYETDTQDIYIWDGASDSSPESTGTWYLTPPVGIDLDITLRASAVIGEASAADTAVDNLGWVRSFVAHLDVTGVRTGGSTGHLDVYIQTQLASGDWLDIVHFTQIDLVVVSEIVSWGPPHGDLAGIGAEGTAITFDRFFAEQDVGMSETNLRLTPLGNSLRSKHVYTAGDSSAGDYTFALVLTTHS